MQNIVLKINLFLTFLGPVSAWLSGHFLGWLSGIFNTFGQIISANGHKYAEVQHLHFF
jgi:hypothetical protein